MRFALLAVIIIFSASVIHSQNRSIYTGLSEKDCRTLEATDEEGGSYRGVCPGVGGYKLELLEGDLRQSINVVDPKGTKHELKFWEMFGGFSSVGPRAEWRMKGKTPVALIVRFNVSENPEDSTKITSYLVVIKITPSDICVTDALKPTRSHNAEARGAADRSAKKRCRLE
ncbi:MAG: hypothetical protein AB7Q37_06525 [Pyrinomonadaceae bacterium]